jgi:N-methylhydantoinase B
MSGAVDPITLRVAAGSLAAACDEMGELLVRAAHSPNIKERRDCSTGLFDANGSMVMQAEHIPVHLGAMPDAVTAVMAHRPLAGETWIVNDPFEGGTHLPDITLVIAVDDHAGRPLGFAASRAHHADVGADTPGSMPADSRSIGEEGVIIPPTRIGRDGSLDPAAVAAITSRMRGERERRTDLLAQQAACLRGAERLLDLATHMGRVPFDQALDAVLGYAERQMRVALAALPDRHIECGDVLESAQGADLTVRLAITKTGERLVLDFTGTDPVHEGNLNCPLAVTRSACYFAARAMLAPDAPACAGAYRPIEVIAPPGTLVNAQHPAAVAGGNVETSSRIADLVLHAFGRADGQGTMNNLTLGNDRFTYYETIAGGQGASAAADGSTAVHVAMSNTLNTPVEALELELPLRVVEYAVRRGSGGAGLHRGGDGVVRELQALEPMDYSLMADRRRHTPRGAEGGEDGDSGADRAGDDSVPGKHRGNLDTGQSIRIKTPGGGGWGAPVRNR